MGEITHQVPSQVLLQPGIIRIRQWTNKPSDWCIRRNRASWRPISFRLTRSVLLSSERGTVRLNRVTFLTKTVELTPRSTWVPWKTTLSRGKAPSTQMIRNQQEIKHHKRLKRHHLITGPLPVANLCFWTEICVKWSRSERQHSMRMWCRAMGWLREWFHCRSSFTLRWIQRTTCTTGGLWRLNRRKPGHQRVRKAKARRLSLASGTQLSKPHKTASLMFKGPFGSRISRNSCFAEVSSVRG